MNNFSNFLPGAPPRMMQQQAFMQQRAAGATQMMQQPQGMPYAGPSFQMQRPQGMPMMQGMGAPNLNPMMPSVYVTGSTHRVPQQTHQQQGVPNNMMPTVMMPNGMMPHAVPSSMQQLAAQQHAMAMQMNQMMQQMQMMQQAQGTQQAQGAQQPQGTIKRTRTGMEGRARKKRCTAKFDQQWEDKYKALVQFKNQNGHANVPTRLGELGGWVRQQRLCNKQNKLRPERKIKLVELGFVFNIGDPVPVPTATASASSATAPLANVGGATPDVRSEPASADISAPEPASADVPIIGAPVLAAPASAQVPAVRAAPAPSQATGPTASTNDEAPAAAPPANQGGAINGLGPASEDVPPPQSVASTNVASAPPQATTNAAADNGAPLGDAPVVLAATAPPQAADSTDSASGNYDSTLWAADQDEEGVDEHFGQPPNRTATNNNGYDSDTSSVITGTEDMPPASILFGDDEPPWDQEDSATATVKAPTLGNMSNDAKNDQSSGGCRICRENKAICVALPCKHLFCCVSCARKMCCGHGGNGKPVGEVQCAICRQDVVEMMQVYF